MNKVRKYFKEARISEFIQSFIWIISIMGMTIGICKLFIHDQSFEDSIGFIVVFIIVSLIHQFLIYNEVHSAEDKIDELKIDYGQWIGSAWERLIRFLIYFFLLWAAGKISSTFLKFIPRENYCIDNEYVFGNKGLLAQMFWPDGNKHNFLLITGAFLAFLFMSFWNGCALISNWGDLWQNKRLVFWRILSYLIASLLATFFWLIVWIDSNNNSVGIIATLLILSYCTALVLAYILTLKSKRVQAHAQKYY